MYQSSLHRFKNLFFLGGQSFESIRAFSLNCNPLVCGLIVLLRPVALKSLYRFCSANNSIASAVANEKRGRIYCTYILGASTIHICMQSVVNQQSLAKCGERSKGHRFWSVLIYLHTYIMGEAALLWKQVLQEREYFTSLEHRQRPLGKAKFTLSQLRWKS